MEKGKERYCGNEAANVMHGRNAGDGRETMDHSRLHMEKQPAGYSLMK